MLTALLILVALILVAGLVTLGCQLASGCPFAWFTLLCGGFGTLAELLAHVMAAIFNQD